MQTAAILIGGDIFPTKNKELFSEGKIGQLFSEEIIDLFRRADYAVCNLEGALTTASVRRPKCGPYLKADPGTSRALGELGIDLVTLANNHITDFGRKGMEETFAALEKEGIRHFGAGENERHIVPFIKLEMNGCTAGIYAVSETVFNIPDEKTEGVNLYDEYRVCNELKSLKNECDILIVLYHGGVEYFRYPTLWLKTRFHRMADCGADIVIAQHSHCIGAKEDYNGSYLLYGQGNFHFDYGVRPDVTRTGILLEIVLQGKAFEVKHHLIHLEGEKAVYDHPQDLSEFEARSQRLARGDDLQSEFSSYCEEWTAKWLTEFRGNRFAERALRKLLPRDQYLRFLRRKYKKHTILRMLEHVRGEEDMEILQRGLQDFYMLQDSEHA